MSGAVLMRMMCDQFIARTSAVGSPGIDPLRWLRPARTGDRLSARVTVRATRRSQGKPDGGSIVLHQEPLNQANEVVMSLGGRAIVRCRAA